MALLPLYVGICVSFVTLLVVQSFRWGQESRLTRFNCVLAFMYTVCIFVKLGRSLVH